MSSRCTGHVEHVEHVDDRYALACLAALYPEHGRPMLGEVTAMAGTYAGTQPGAYLRLAEALLAGDDDQALGLAEEIVGWQQSLDPGLLADTDVPASVRAAQVLVGGALFATADDHDCRP